jgi:hypothetical protein
MGSRSYLYLALLASLCALGVSRYYPAQTDQAVVPVDGEPMADMASGDSIPDPMLLSKWLATRTQRYRTMMKIRQCDVLIVPVQVEGRGFDRATRNLMAADIALSIKHGDQCIADPLFTDIALGEGLRRHSDEDIARLATSIGATTVVATWAGHDQSGHMRVTMQVSRSAAAGASAHVVAKKSFEDISYSDDDSPFDKFHESLPRMLHAIGLDVRERGPVNAGSLAKELPESPTQLLQIDHASALDKSARLTLLGILAPRRDSTAADRLLTKALLGLIDVDAADALTKRMRGHILLHLRERPYALAAIRDVRGPEAEGLRAILNGDLPSARAALEKIQSPWERLFVAIETYDLEMDYARDGDAAATAVLGMLGPKWAALVTTRQADDDIWIRPDVIALKQSLDESFPIAGQSLEDLTRGNYVLGQVGDYADYDLLALKHVHALLDAHPSDWCCSGLKLGPSQADLLDLYDNRVERALVGRAHFYVTPQGLFQRALDMLAKYDVELAGNAYAEFARTNANWYLFDGPEVGNRDARNNQMHAAGRIALVAAPGQTMPATNSLWYLMRAPVDPIAWKLGNAYCEDFPIRPEWYGTHETLQPRLQFSTSEIAPLKDLLKNSTGEQHQKFAAELDHRFIGNSDATQLRLSEEAGKDELSPPVLLEGIANDPDNWILYSLLSDFYVGHGEYAQASSLVQSYPLFQKKTRHTVELSDTAMILGDRLYYLGQIDAAVPLLKIASGYDNGSGASVDARAKLAILDRDYTSAAMAYFECGQHYSDLTAYSHYLSLLFAGGESASAWNGFDHLASQFQSPQPWLAAVIGHRRDNISERDLRAWIGNEAKKNNARPDDDSLVTYALMEQLMDRPEPTPGFAEFIAGLAGPSNVQASPDGKQFFWTTKAEGRRRVGPSQFGRERRAAATSQATVPNRYALLALAYAALRTRHFDESVSAFDQLAAIYDIEKSNDWGFALPYFAFAAAQSGDALGLEKYLNSRDDVHDQWGPLLAKAVFAALHDRRDESDKLLDTALRERPATGLWPITTAYQYAETCAWLFDLTHDERYRQRALAWARAYSRIEPVYAWPHALIAHLAADHNEAREALALALHLDPQSAWAKQTPHALQDEAMAWLKKNEPFKLSPPGKSA